jgi:hypothetical protein
VNPFHTYLYLTGLFVCSTHGNFGTTAVYETPHTILINNQKAEQNAFTDIVKQKTYSEQNLKIQSVVWKGLKAK